MKGIHDRLHVVAVDLPRIPAEGAPFVRHRLHVEHDPSVRLDAVAVDQRDEIVEPKTRAGHRRLPGRTLLHLAIREFDEYPRRRRGMAESERHAHPLPQTMTERPADDLDARGRVERAHLKPAVVGAVCGQLVHRDDPALGQRRPERDRVMTRRQQKAIAILPGEVLRIVAKLVEVKRSEQVGYAKALSDVTLSRPARHLQNVATHVCGAQFQRTYIRGLGTQVTRHLVDQSLSSPPLTLSRSAVM